MRKSGLIIGALSFLVSVVVGLVLPLCVPCLALLLGAAAGYLAGQFDKPLSNDTAVKAGALAGALGGIGAILGQVVASVVRTFVVGPADVARIVDRMGLPTPPAGTFMSSYWIGLIGGTVCFSLLDILFMAALGAVGGMIWWRMNSKNSPPAAITTPEI